MTPGEALRRIDYPADRYPHVTPWDRLATSKQALYEQRAENVLRLAQKIIKATQSVRETP